MKQARRLFIKQGVLGALLLGATSNLHAVTPNTTKKKSKKSKDLFKLGMAGYTFANFDLDTTLKTMEKLDLHYLCIKNFHLPFDSSDAEIKAFKEKLASKNIIGYGVGPIYMKSKKEIDDAFDYANRIGVKTIVGVPNVELLPYVSQKVAEHDLNYAIHLHGPDIDIYQDATEVWNHTKDLDPRVGMCLDIGHDLRNGCDPTADLKKYHSRVFDVHIKDVTAASKEGRGIEFGRGIIDFPAFIDMMRQVKYTGVCSLEYEKDMKDPFLGIAESIGYFKAVADHA